MPRDRRNTIILHHLQTKLHGQIMHTGTGVIFHYKLRPCGWIFCAEWQCKKKNGTWVEDVFISVILKISSWACKGRAWANRKGSVTPMSLVRRCHESSGEQTFETGIWQKMETIQIVTGVWDLLQPLTLHGNRIKMSEGQMVMWLSLLMALKREEKTG